MVTHTSPSVDRDELRKSPKRRLSFWIWVLLPILVLFGSELAVRKIVERSGTDEGWYEGVSAKLANGRVDYLFIGTSRTASGLVPRAFEEGMRAAGGGEVVCVNLGRAFSGAPAHFFGLRELLRRHSGEMARCTVSFEMAAGLPAFPGSWEDDWFFPGNTQLVVDYMQRDDLFRFLRTSASFESKAGVVARFLGRGSALVAHRRALQQWTDWYGVRLLRSTLNRLGAKSGAVAEAELPTHRQLRTDAGGVRLQRDLIIERTSPEALSSQAPLRPWREQVLCDAARMLRENGVPVCFHEVPVPSYVWQVNETSVRLSDREAFAEWCGGLGIVQVSVPIDVTDEDFPDLSHLRAARIEEYSRVLARSLVEMGE